MSKNCCLRIARKSLTLAGVLFLLLSTLPGCGNLRSLMAGEPVTVSFAYLEGAADYQPLADAFQRENPNITIELKKVSLNGNVQRNFAAQVAEADTLRIPATAISDEVVQALLPLDSQISTDRSFPADDLYPHSLEGLRLDGKQVAIPAGIDPYVFFYVPKKFAAAGVQSPPPMWTLEEFLNLALSMNRVVESEINTPRYAYGFCSHPQLTDPIMFAYLFGGGLVDDPYVPTRPTLNSAANVEALTWYASLNTDFGLLPPARNPREIYREIEANHCGFWMDLLDRSTFGAQRDNETVPLPMPNYRAPFGAATLDGYAILKSTEHANEAWLWIRYLMENQQASGVLIPPIRKAAGSAEYKSRVNAATADVASSLPDQLIILGLEMYRDSRFEQVLDLYNQAANQVMQGEADPQTALDQAQMEAEERFR
jgi:ABC-type glycerol-3-phosphate transport system substrate-binding protein